jgi:hypothetical protein
VSDRRLAGQAVPRSGAGRRRRPHCPCAARCGTAGRRRGDAAGFLSAVLSGRAGRARSRPEAASSVEVENRTRRTTSRAWLSVRGSRAAASIDRAPWSSGFLHQIVDLARWRAS